MTLYLDNTNFSTYVKNRGYTVAYRKVVGPNSFTTLDGKYHEDVIAKKAVVSVPLNPVNSSQLAALTAACYDAKKATFYDTEQGADVTRDVTATLSEVSVLMTKNGTQYWGTEILLTLEEK